MAKHLKETEMVRTLLDMLVDYLENYSKKTYSSLINKVNMMSPSILAGTVTRENVSKEWMKTVGTIGAVGAIIAGTAVASLLREPIAAGETVGWLAKVVMDTSKKKGDK